MIASPGPRFVAYYRVSTDQQGRLGLGLDAQRDAVARHAAGCGGSVAAAFEEVESGRRSDRPQLGLGKAGVEFVAVDMPYANRLTIGVMALVAEEEARATSTRTKAALAAAKARETKFGNPRLLPGDSATAADARAAWSAAAGRRAAEVLPYVVAARRAGATTLQQLADALPARGVRTPRGGEGWRPWQVRHVLDRLCS